MREILGLMQDSTEFAAIMAALQQREASEQLVYGLTGAQKSVLIAAIRDRLDAACLVVVPTPAQAEQTLLDLSAFLPPERLFLLPAAEILPYTVLARSVEPAAKRLEVFARLSAGEKIAVVAPTEAIMPKMLPQTEFAARSITLRTGNTVDREGMLTELVAYGYERVDQVEHKGQVSVRGGIIDIYPLNREWPIRIELFGDELDSLREFDPLTQRSRANLPEVLILPAGELRPVTGNHSTLFDYFPPDTVFFFDEPLRLREAAQKYERDNQEHRSHLIAWPDIAAVATARRVVYLALMPQKIPYGAPRQITGIPAKTLPPFQRQMGMLATELGVWKEKQYRIVITVTTAMRAHRLQQLLQEENLEAAVVPELTRIAPGSVVITTAHLSQGFEFPGLNLVVITEKEIFGKQKKKRITTAGRSEKLIPFRDLHVGDYVVHVNHGIGKYAGVETLEVDGVHRDYFLIRYAGEDKLYVPTDQAGLLQKYIGAEGEPPKLHKLGGTEWLKTKNRAKAAVEELAKDLLALYAARQTTPGFKFSPDTPWQKDFEDAFPYAETPDQLQAIADVKRDMESGRPMDRLLCGDVGFGKTEVAMRAAFKAVMDGKQVAILVPTTILAQQHHQTFTARFAGFPVNVDVISRFRTEREQQATLKKLALGQIDILIGTHRVLQPDVQFKDLGLVIIDEEQRFGVMQKERLKQWRTNVAVLTMTATPIPRTLHMSLAGVRDMSVIETPPEDRFPVQTYVVEYSDEIVRDAILREMKRGGQVYFVYNRVQTIDKIQLMLQQLVPSARIAVAHGQMPEDRLERVMLAFYQGKYDILVCTSIVENGLDLPNVNTLIVYDADHFGLAQLYQLRGRVGRSHRIGYAYLTYRRDKVLSEVAEKRLQAIKEFTELGAGFKIALRDLEIRGAGNLLGAEQHGHLVSVGFEMYCRLLEDAIAELKGIPAAEPVPEPVLELKVDAYISDKYIANGMQKIEIYQKIATARDHEAIAAILDELLDRFGDPPPPVMNLLKVARLKVLARSLAIQSIVQTQDRVTIQFTEHSRVSPEAVVQLTREFRNRISLSPALPPSLTIRATGITGEKLLAFIGDCLDKLVPAAGEKAG